MPEDVRIPLAEEGQQRKNACHITVAADHIYISWDFPLEEGPHRVTRVEAMAAGALIGIARTLTGKGMEETVLAMANATGRKRRG